MTSDNEIRRRQEPYRAERPSELHRVAMQQVLTEGGVAEDAIEEMVDRLYDPQPDRRTDLPVDPFEPTLPTQDEGNGLGSAVTRNEFGITLHISEKLFHQQPIGVLLRPITNAVSQRGEAMITDVYPRSEDVEPGIMPCYHYNIEIEPTPVWLAKWFGHRGYETIE